jgi:hypothetical protein
VLGQVSQPNLHVSLPEHSILAGVALAETQILSSAVISVATWARVLATGAIADNSTEAWPMLVAGEVAGRRLVIISFDLRQSDLPLRPAFPILMANLMNYLAPGAVNLLPNQLQAGGSLNLSLPPAVSEVQISNPDGTILNFEISEGSLTLPPLMQVGLYQLSLISDSSSQVKDIASFAVNFLNPSESDIQVQPDLLTDSAQTSSGQSLSTQPAYREWWRYLALLALLILLLEWMLYHRGRLTQLGLDYFHRN